MRWLFSHPAGWFIAVMALWSSIWVFSAALEALTRKDVDDVGDKDDREGSD